MMSKNIFEIKQLSKKYPGIEALKNISFNVEENTIHCIVGENGAGKSTFIKILVGAEKKNSGEIYYNGQIYNPRSIREAMNNGVSVIFQELNTIEQLTVGDNLTLGVEKTRVGIIQKINESENIFKILKELDEDILIKQKVAELSIAKKQTIEIAKALAQEAKVIIMDEPTASLSVKEIERLFEILHQLKRSGVTIIYISHKLEEIFQLGDRVTILRDGMIVGSKKVSEISDHSDLIKLMTGRIIADHYIPSNIDYSKKVLKIDNLNTNRLEDIKFTLYKGEILGFFGLVGSGKSEIARAIYKADRVKSLSLKINDKILIGKIPKKVIKKGISMVPEERRSEGLFSKLSVRENIIIMKAKKFSRFSFINKHKERKAASEYIKKLHIVAKNQDQEVLSLSGGNQQKVVIAKCLCSDSDVLLMDEPTRGVDVGAKNEVHNIIRELSKEGKSIIIFSSELPEIVNLCDRIILLSEGMMIKELKNKNINSYEIMHLVMGGSKDDNSF